MQDLLKKFENIDFNDSVVLCSGGVDSTTLLYLAVKLAKSPDRVRGLSIFYGQQHAYEILLAEKHFKDLGITYKIISIPQVTDLLNNSALINTQIPLPMQVYSVETQKVTVVPNRNMILLSLAIAWAENENLSKVLYAAHHNDHAVYPDCRPEFVKAINNAAQLGTYNKIQVIAPFVNMYKHEIVQLGVHIGVDYKYTWSCYRAPNLAYEGETPVACGKCGTCRERIEAFRRANVGDPMRYEEA